MQAAPTILEIERATLSAVPAPRIAFDGGFVVRSFAGGTGRANAACPLDPSPDPALTDRIARIEAFYRRAGFTPRFRSTPLDPPGMVEALQARGYRPHDESQVIVGPLGPLFQDDPDCTALAGPEPDWTRVMASGEHQVPARQAEKARMPELLGVPAAWILLRVEGEPAACAFATADGELAGLFDLAVRKEFRRRGLGRRVMSAAGAWARSRGARWAYAQVACTNAASLALNAGLGLTERYRYRYFLPG
ncbi:GNAT family N-acetyltransferase [Falsiroseomonas bella]|uniref:GNAT family N-acetyltransferase n=1 Tax=Falsiroseomonas bella TaxID=2184016 RepID=A0A317FKC8_9PROT|nr:GNAT family N-acetyltransferase [Falsiroseomonas bella]PWS38557.1 GNAT family N-acetyltransferase [Falsiroseomonas bella]